MLKFVNIIKKGIEYHSTFEMHKCVCLMTVEAVAGKTKIVYALGLML